MRGLDFCGDSGDFLCTFCFSPAAFVVLKSNRLQLIPITFVS